LQWLVREQSQEDREDQDSSASHYQPLLHLGAGDARAKMQSAEQRKAIGQKAARARWAKS